MRIAVSIGLCGVLGCGPRSGELQAIPATFVVEAVATGEAEVGPPVTWTVVDPSLWDDARDEPVRDVVYTEPGELPLLLVAGAPLPLRHTDVRAHLRGEVAEVVVTQRFVNDRAGPIEAIYSFPLPENSAVTDMRMTIGTRVIEAEIKGREEALRTYVDARHAGRTAALLEQERPNLFTQSVANIPPREAVEVELRYLQTISYDAGEYEFVFPTVIGRRYVSAAVTDAARISPPVLGHGVRSGHDIAIEVVAEAGAPISAWVAPAHAVEAKVAGERLQVTLARRDELPNRDFVLRYRGAGPRPTARMFVGPEGADGGHFMLIAEPPRLDVDALVGRRELIFVVDVSGSMRGGPLALAQATMQTALAGVRPVDTFNVLVFAGATGRLFAAPRPASAANLELALEYIGGLYAAGGTEIGQAVTVALEGEVAVGRDRHVLFLTDGHVGDEDAIARGTRVLLERQGLAGRRARVFGVGIGAAPNEHLIDTMSQAGRGAPLYVRYPTDVAAAATNFARLADAPVLTDVTVDWHGLAVSDLSPGTARDLLATRPLVVVGRYRGEVPAELTLSGRVGARSFSFPIAVTRLTESEEVMGRLWARARIGELDLTRATSESPAREELARAEIRSLGLRHHLVTAYTSLVAVDRSRPLLSGAPLTIVQPGQAPQGTRPVFSLGGAGGGRSTAVESRYVVDGANATSPAFGTVSATIVQEYVDSPGLLERGPSVEAHAHARVRRVRASDGADALKAGLRGVIGAVGACFVSGDRADYRVRQLMTLVVRRGEDGEFAVFGVRAARQIDPDVAACVRRRIEPALRAGLRPGASAEIELGVRMQF